MTELINALFPLLSAALCALTLFRMLAPVKEGADRKNKFELEPGMYRLWMAVAVVLRKIPVAAVTMIPAVAAAVTAHWRERMQEKPARYIIRAPSMTAPSLIRPMTVARHWILSVVQA